MIRSYLYVPGDRPDRFDKAVASGADAVILDLEDAVAVSKKDEARAAVEAWLGARAPGGPRIVVRVNNGTALNADARAAARADALSLPKATVADLDRLEGRLPVIALIETARGVLDARAIASHPRVARLAIGEADLGAELQIAPASDAWMAIRAGIVVASAAAEIEPPVGPVSTDFRDLDALRASTEVLRDAGFGARAAIHPAQVPVINGVFTPDDETVARARALVERFDAAGGGVATDDDGRMIDEAIVRSARRIIASLEEHRR